MCSVYHWHKAVDLIITDEKHLFFISVPIHVGYARSLNHLHLIHMIHIIMFIWIIRVPLVYLRSRSADHQCFLKFCWIINKETLITHYCSFWSNLRRNLKIHFWNGCEVFAVENFLLKDQEPSNYSKGTIKFNYSIWNKHAEKKYSQSDTLLNN